MNSKGKILVVEDHESMRETLEIFFTRSGYQIECYGNAQEAIKKLADKPPWELIITDLVMPQKSGFDILEEAKKVDATIQVVVITAFAKTEDAVKAMKLGAYDYIQKPFSMEELEQTAANAIEKCRLLRENISFRKTISSRYGFNTIIGESPSLKEVLATCSRIKDLPSNILITGESGTGKELIARAIHFGSPRSAAPFVVIDCGSIPENLMESELFGHIKGAFTGAISSYEGLLRPADGGTVFFDEIGELPLQLQTKLLRVLQDKLIKPVGGTEEFPVDIRVIAATNRNIEAEVKEGKFRKDLYYRLNVIRIDIPPLRERKEDISLLASHFAKKFSTQFGKQTMQFTEEALKLLLSYNFPGNVRELSNLVERMVALETKDKITAETVKKCFEMGKVFPEVEDTTREIVQEVMKTGLDAYMGVMEEKILRFFLKQYSGDKRKIASLLGITERSLRYRLSKYGLISNSE